MAAIIEQGICISCSARCQSLYDFCKSSESRDKTGGIIPRKQPPLVTSFARDDTFSDRYVIDARVWTWSVTPEENHREILRAPNSISLYDKATKSARNSEIPMKLNRSSNYCLNDRTVGA